MSLVSFELSAISAFMHMPDIGAYLEILPIFGELMKEVQIRAEILHTVA